MRRVEGLVPWERVFVLTNSAQCEAVRAELPFLPPENILAEPAKRDTAPACAPATGFARARDPLALCALLPADAMIHNVPASSVSSLTRVGIAAARNTLVTFAIPPTHPATGFGYLHLGEPIDGACRVLRFVEKPDLPSATTYLQSGQYAWNAGMFIWRAEVFYQETCRLIPVLADFIEQFPKGDLVPYLSEKFENLPRFPWIMP